MSRRDWLYVIALGGLIAGSAHAQTDDRSGVAIAAPITNESAAGNTDQTQQHAEPFSVPVRIIEDPIKAEHTRKREQKSDKHEADDLKAQRRAAKAAELSATAAERQIIPTWLQSAFAVIGTIALLYTLWLTRESVRVANLSAAETIEANRIARDSAMRQLRAYVGIVRTEIVEDLDNPGGPVFRIHAKNFGQTPADEVTIASGTSFGRYPASDASLDLEFDLTSDVKPPFPVGPSAEFKHTNRFKAPLGFAEKLAMGDGIAAIYFIGEIRYTDAFGRARLTTFKFYYGGQRPLADKQLTHWREGNSQT